jgi:hypothetical protein
MTGAVTLQTHLRCPLEALYSNALANTFLGVLSTHLQEFEQYSSANKRFSIRSLRLGAGIDVTPSKRKLNSLFLSTRLDMVTEGAAHLQVFLVSQTMLKCKRQVSKILLNLISFMYKQLQIRTCQQLHLLSAGQ